MATNIKSSMAYFIFLVVTLSLKECLAILGVGFKSFVFVRTITTFSFSGSLASDIDDLDLAAEYRAVTGVLQSQSDSKSISIISASITFHGVEILLDSTLDLNSGARYGLVGPNGCGM